MEVNLDFETASAVDLTEVGAYAYAQHPTTEILCLTWVTDFGYSGTLRARDLAAEQHHFPGGDVAGSPSDLWLYVSDPGVTFVAHNSGFEKAIWREIMVKTFGWPDIRNDRWDDTMAACAMRNIPLGLDAAARTMDLENQKDVEASKFTRTLGRPNKKTGMLDRSPTTLARVEQYNMQDIKVMMELRQRVGTLTPGERKVWLLDQRINERGIKLDLDYIRQAQKIIADAKVPMEQEFRDLTGGLEVTQVKKIMAWLCDRGYKGEGLGKELIKETLENSNVWNLGEDTRRVLEIRQAIGSSSIKKLNKMLEVIGEDGRARGTLQYHTAIHGRWGGRLFQPHNFPRGTIIMDERAVKPQLVYDAIMTGDVNMVALLGNPIDVVAGGLRHAIIADEGHELVSGDFATIEARIVLALAGQWDKVEMLAKDEDIYCDMASQIYEHPVTKQQVEKRQTGKNSVLGLGFQMAAETFQSKYAKKHPLSFCEGVVHTYRKKWAPKVPYVWYGLSEASGLAVKTGLPHTIYGVTYQMEGEWLTATIHSGRKIWYYNPQYIGDDDWGRPKWCYDTTENGRPVTVHAFGGLLTNHVVSGLARDIMVTPMFKLERAGIPVVLTVHDEILTEPRLGTADEKVVANTMESVQQWVRDLRVPIKVETWHGPRYKK